MNRSFQKISNLITYTFLVLNVCGNIDYAQKSTFEALTCCFLCALDRNWRAYCVHAI